MTEKIGKKYEEINIKKEIKMKRFSNSFTLREMYIKKT